MSCYLSRLISSKSYTSTHGLFDQCWLLGRSITSGHCARIVASLLLFIVIVFFFSVSIAVVPETEPWNDGTKNWSIIWVSPEVAYHRTVECGTERSKRSIDSVYLQRLS